MSLIDSLPSEILCLMVKTFALRSRSPSELVRLRLVSRRLNFYAAVHAVGIRNEVVDIRHTRIDDSGLLVIASLVKAGKACRRFMLGEFCQCSEETSTKCGPCSRLSPFSVRHALQAIASSCDLRFVDLIDIHNAGEVIDGLGGFFNGMEHLSLERSQLNIKRLLSIAFYSRRLTSLDLSFIRYCPFSMLDLLSNKYLFPKLKQVDFSFTTTTVQVVRALIRGRPSVRFVDVQWTDLTDEDCQILQAEFAAVEIAI